MHDIALNLNEKFLDSSFKSLNSNQVPNLLLIALLCHLKLKNNEWNIRFIIFLIVISANYFSILRIWLLAESTPSFLLPFFLLNIFFINQFLKLWNILFVWCFNESLCQVLIEIPFSAKHNRHIVIDHIVNLEISNL